MTKPNRRTLAITLAAMGALAVPALTGPGGSTADASTVVFPKPQKAAATVAATSREARRVQRRRRALARGPVHPLAAQPDYGTVENGFGAARSGHTHAGQDIFAPAGTPLVAVSGGVVAEAGSDGAQGNYVYLYDEANRRTYVYMHLIAPAKVRTGDLVKAGQPLGGVGCTGSCWGDHLHFEVRAGRGIAGAAQDPLPLLESWDRVSR
ncbi:MAG: M23 family metallopeptidase [Solirubrobacterales bacterium]